MDVSGDLESPVWLWGWGHWGMSPHKAKRVFCFMKDIWLEGVGGIQRATHVALKGSRNTSLCQVKASW
jgi:hypothetical protein